MHHEAAQRWIRRLRLKPHPEGGYYREYYRSRLSLPARGLPPLYGGRRTAGTAIYFLLAGADRSRWHRLRTDEIWMHQAGSALTVFLIHANGRLEKVRLGSRGRNGEQPALVIPAGCWFGARVARPRSYALISCTVSPGFEFQDFELADPAALRRRFPRHRRAIAALEAMKERLGEQLG